MLNRKATALVGIIVLLHVFQADSVKSQHQNEASTSDSSISTQEAVSSSNDNNSNQHAWFDITGVLRNTFKLPVSALENEAKNERGGLIWKRPENVAQFPHTWHTFKAKNTTGQEVEFIIKDIPKRRFNEVIDLMALYVLKSEPIYQALGIWTDPNAVNIFKVEWELLLQQKMSVACFRNDGSDTIVGINILSVLQKDDVMFKLIPDYTNYNINRLEQLYRRIKFDTFKHYKVTEFLGSAGIGVDPDYKNFGIDGEFLKSRDEICRKFGLTLTSTLFTSPESNTIANQLDFKIDYSISYKEIRNVIPEFSSIARPRITLRSKEYK